ncbi:MAG TPA: hypothetical protein VN437_02055, partial [Rectinemataceae bacterium]|nr:hypothetical protein [Rectinemataceae bacterium]
ETDAKEDLISEIKTRLSAAGHRLLLSDTSLELASPEAVLKRGYSIIRKSKAPDGSGHYAGQGLIVRSSSEISPDEFLDVTFSSGTARVEVREVGK